MLCFMWLAITFYCWNNYFWLPRSQRETVVERVQVVRERVQRHNHVACVYDESCGQQRCYLRWDNIPRSLATGSSAFLSLLNVYSKSIDINLYRNWHFGLLVWWLHLTFRTVHMHKDATWNHMRVDSSSIFCSVQCWHQWACLRAE